MARSELERNKERLPINETQAPAEGGPAIKQPTLDKQRHYTDIDRQNTNSVKFPLPHQDYPQEGHTGYVYTIQLSGKWLVSGGADKTIRVWDLETRRLRGDPLIGHSLSVLCLQFDPSEKEDVIISGSSDASVIVWRFSTGQPLKIIPAAHEETILDLRFNQRHLFTASKDMSIKIWSRHELTPLDQDYPRIQNGPHASVPSHVIDLSSTEPSLIEAGLANGSIQSLQPYTHLATLRGHVAAVNSVDVHGDLLFSASGDRTICVWNTTTGQRIRQLVGFEKGLACIQSDAKRIVSGGSDNSVRIHDLDTGTEVAVLLGHLNLVRTLQADFDGVLDGILDKPHQATQNLENGSKCNRIVSGSYDESIIIWKKDAHGSWSVEHTLRLEATDALLSHTAPRATSIGDYHGPYTRKTEPRLRVFKVRFDAKRLVCSSQDSRIYCWEFGAN